MALLGASIGLNDSYMTTFIDSATLARYLAGGADRITVYDAVTDQFRSAAIKGGYSAVSIDALTTVTVPVTILRWLAHGALDEMSSGGMGRPDEVGTWGVEYRKWLSRLATGNETIDALSNAAPTGGAISRVSAPASLVFDRDNPDNRYNARDRSI